MEGIKLQFDFLQNSILLVFCSNDEHLLNLKKYYSDYYIVNAEVRQETEEVSFTFTSESKCEVAASFYQLNPKQYTVEHPLKFCIDVIDDYITMKIEQQLIVDRIFLHGSCVVYNGMPIVLIGKSKSGKSTVALKLLHRLPKTIFLSDDFLSLKVKESFVEVEPYRMPLHIRMGSLYFNQIYRTEPIDNEQVYVDMWHFGKKQEVSITVTSIFEVSYGMENRIREVQGLEKIEVLVRNLKYYHLQMVKQIAILASKIRVYQLAYSIDDFMVQGLLRTMHLKDSSFPCDYINALIKSRLAKEDSIYVTVQGNSMYPALRHNQKVLVEKVRPEDICEGDVIFFQRKKHATIHRVVRVTQNSARRIFYTQGDNNEVCDQLCVLEEDVFGKVNMEDSI